MCLPAIALSLAMGITLGEPAAGMVAAGGALSVGFGAFQQLSTLRALPMILAAIGMAVSTLVGSVLGAHALPFALLLGLWAGFCGLATTLGAGAWWTVLQWVIAMLVAGSRPGSLLAGAERALLVLAGGGLQVLIVTLARALRLLPDAATQPLPRAPLRTAGRLLRRHLSWGAPTGRYAVVLAISVGALDIVARRLDLPNGYWAPMTLLILLKPAFRDTLKRGVQRILGTLFGAGAATLAAAYLRPSEPMTAVMITASAFGAYVLLRVNYLAYSLCMTAYIAFMLTLAGTPEPVVALNRVVGTVAGGLAALVVHSAWAASERWRIQKNIRPAPALHHAGAPGH
ncbi:MAG: FUSC family protein [Caulobacteraceae bacterium]